MGHEEALKLLTPREIEILEHVAQGKTNKQVGSELGIAPSTVKTHRRNICRKLNLAGRYALIRWAIRHMIH